MNKKGDLLQSFDGDVHKARPVTLPNGKTLMLFSYCPDYTTTAGKIKPWPGMSKRELQAMDASYRLWKADRDRMSA